MGHHNARIEWNRADAKVLHREAHDACYLSNSVLTVIRIEPTGFEA